MKYLWLVCFIPLVGCGEQPQVIVTAPPEVKRTFLRDVIPGNELNCQKEPDGSKVSTVRQSAKYVVDLRKAGSDCRQKLSSVRDIIQQEH